VGNFGSVFREATERSYRLLLEGLEAHPQLHYALHVSGPLLEWWTLHDPSPLDLLRPMVASGQAELLTGGLYEPILPILPPADRVDQIRLHRDLLRRLFDVDSRGLWLTERVYEPSLPADLCAAGVDYLPIDDTHLLAAGIEEHALDGAFLTEDHGNTLRVFPISAPLRYLIPFEPVEKVMVYLREQWQAGRRLLVFGDDGEKFGLWPETFEFVHASGWWKDLLAAFAAAADWLSLVRFDEVVDEPVRGKVYLPAASYFEMEEWALPIEAGRALHAGREEIRSLPDGARLGAFLRGGSWRSFLARYPESNRIYQRMLRVSAATHAAGLRPAAGLRSHPELPEAVRALFRAQCNCAYWHGVFGGLHLPFLREALIEELLRARALLEPAAPPRVEALDLDADGASEVLLEAGEWQLWIAPSRGGIVEVMDSSVTLRDYASVLGRREEAYHADVIASAAADEAAGDEAAGDEAAGDRAGPAAAEVPRSIHDRTLRFTTERTDLFDYDVRPRGCFSLSIVPAGVDPDMRAAVPDVDGPWTLERPAGEAGCSPEVTLRARVASPSPATGAIAVERRYRIRGRRVEAEVVLVPEAKLEARIVQRLDLSVPAIGSAARCFVLPDGGRAEVGEDAAFTGDRVDVVEERAVCRLSSSRVAAGTIRPVFTASRSERGVEACFQGSTIMLSVPVELGVGEAFTWTLCFERQEPRDDG
jgi:hypothetical protein